MSVVDWKLATKIAERAAGEGPAAMSGLDLEEIGGRAERAVLDYTGLETREPIPAPEWVTRREWTALNLRSMRELIEPVEDRLTASLPAAGGDLARATAGKILAAEIGLLLGVVSKRVLGQYESPMTGATRPNRLVFVGENIDEASAKLGSERGDVLEWVALHEGTHAVHFAAAPWLRGHLAGLTSELLAGVTLQSSPQELLARARRAASADPRRALAGLRGSDPVTLLASEASRRTIAEVQATMAAVEGYAEHVMDAAAGDLGEVVPQLRAGIERRREARSPIVRLLSWLLGLEMKLRQYRDGKRFADGVVELAGIEGLNGAWAGAESLPTLAELGRPHAWIARTQPATAV